MEKGFTGFIVGTGIIGLIVVSLFFVVKKDAVEPTSEQSQAIQQEMSDENKEKFLFTIELSDGTRNIWGFNLETQKIEGPIDIRNQLFPIRYDHTTNLCGLIRHMKMSLKMMCTLLEKNNSLTLTVADSTSGKVVLSKIISFSEMGIESSASEGYVTPVAVSDDKSTIYLGRRVETESYVTGLWRLDVATGEISEIPLLRDQNIFHYDISASEKKLIGTTFVPPENLGADPTGQSEIYLIDLTTGTGDILLSNLQAVFDNVLLSEDASSFSFGYYGKPEKFIYTTENPHEIATFEGTILDWFHDTLVVMREGNLFLFNLTTKTEIPLIHETNARVKYLGMGTYLYDSNMEQ